MRRMLSIAMAACAGLSAQELPADPLRALLAAPTLQSPAEGVVVEVVDSQGAPVPDAVVGFVRTERWPQAGAELRAWQERVKALPPRARDAAFLLAFGERFRADAAGRVVLPADAPTLLSAFTGDGHGIGAIDRDSAAPTRLVTWRQTRLLVRVTDPAGRPVGDVAVGMAASPADLPRATGFTDRRGIAEISVPLHVLSSEREVTVYAAIGANENPSQTVELATATARPVELAVPATASIRVIVYGEDERPRRDIADISMRRQGASPTARVLGRPDESGALFRVSLDHSWSVAASFTKASGNLRKDIAGPTRPGELVICELRGAVGPPILSFLVEGLDGAPVANERLGCILYDERSHDGRMVESDAAGRVHVILPEHGSEDARLLLVRRGPPELPGEPAALLGAAMLRRPAQLRPGTNELPALRLLEEPVVVTGSVVDESGAPVPGADVSATPGWRRSGGGFSGGAGFFEVRARTDRDGRFELRDAAAAAVREITVQPVGSDYAGARASCEGDGKSVELRLPRLGELTLVLEGLPANAQNLLKGTIVATGSDETPQQLDLRGETLLRRPVGSYDLAFGVDRRVAPLTLSGIAIPPLAEHARLSLPWRDHFTAITVTVLQPDGRPCRSQAIIQWVEKPGGGWSGGGAFTDADGRALLLVPKAGGDLQIEGDGKWCGVTLDAQQTDCTVRLRALLRATVDLQGDWSLPDGVSLEFAVASVVPVALGDQRPWAKGRPATVERDGARLDVRVEDPGPYEITIRAAYPAAPQTSRRQGLGSHRITIAATPDQQPLLIAMTEELRERIDALGKR